MIEFITNHIISSFAIIYFFIGLMLAIMFICLEGNEMVITEEFLTGATSLSLTIIGIVTIIGWPIVLTALFISFRKTIIYFEEKHKENANNN